MLNQQQEEREQGYVSPIANLRVTPQELAQAVAAIEAKRDIGANADTISIGEAISQLGLNVTPQEVYAEVRNQQARPVVTPSETSIAVQATDPLQERRSRRRRRLWRIAFAFSLFLNFAGWVRVSSVREYSASEVPNSRTISYSSPAVASSMDTISVAAIGLNTPGYGTLDEIYELANGTKPEEMTVSRSEGDANRFQIIRLNGEFFVRGWHFPSGTFNLNGTTYNEPNHLFAHSWDSTMVTKSYPLSAFKTIKDPNVTMNDYPGVFLPANAEEVKPATKGR